MAGGPVDDNPMPESNISPQSGTLSFDTGNTTCWEVGFGLNIFLASKQCCGSGSESGSRSTRFWAFWIRIHLSEVWIRIRLWIRILLSPSKNSKKNLASYCFVTSFLLFIFENDVNWPSKSTGDKQKNFFFQLVFCWDLEGQWWK